MSTLRRYLAFSVALAAVVALVAGCTDEAEPTPNDSPSSTAPETPGPEGSVALKGKYLYQNAGLRVTADFDGNVGTLLIINKTGRDVPEPSLYIRAADDGARVQGTVEAASGIEDDKRKEFAFEFPPTVNPNTIGLLFLVMGEDDYGAFVPPTAG
ncbi:MAG: hypothetical protein WD206_04395 [Actinomycetota bacterium]